MPYSSTEIMGVVAKIINQKAPMVLGKASKNLGMTLPQYLDSVMPKKVAECLKTVGRMHRRYIAGKYRHHDNEVLQVEVVANYLIDLHQRSIGAEVRPVQLDPRQMEQPDPCPKNTYVRVMEMAEQIN